MLCSGRMSGANGFPVPMSKLFGRKSRLSGVASRHFGRSLLYANAPRSWADLRLRKMSLRPTAPTRLASVFVCVQNLDLKRISVFLLTDQIPRIRTALCTFLTLEELIVLSVQDPLAPRLGSLGQAYACACDLQSSQLTSA